MQISEIYSSLDDLLSDFNYQCVSMSDKSFQLIEMPTANRGDFPKVIHESNSQREAYLKWVELTHEPHVNMFIIKEKTP